VTERDDLAARQLALVRALLADGPVPAGFDAHRIGVEAAALRSKRRTVTAQLRGDLADLLGPRFGPLFDEWATAHPKRVDTSFRADVDGFESWLYAEGHLQRPAADRRRRWWRTASPPDGQ
jgi:hypothetical protein